jgi:hypothetical protein
LEKDGRQVPLLHYCHPWVDVIIRAFLGEHRAQFHMLQKIDSKSPRCLYRLSAIQMAFHTSFFCDRKFLDGQPHLTQIEKQLYIRYNNRLCRVSLERQQLFLFSRWHFRSVIYQYLGNAYWKIFRFCRSDK